MWTRVRALPRTRRLRRTISAAAAVGVSAALLGVPGFGYGTIPALGPALGPCSTRAWRVDVGLVPLWWDGQYLPVPVPGDSAGSVGWRLHG